jgi:sugar transferase (PEP-CTERM/EpsH1 system associated)
MSWLYGTEGRRLRRLEQSLPGWAAAVILSTEAEVELYRSFSAPGSVHAIPNGVDLDFFRPQAQPEEPACVFVGALDYLPNVDGVCWFCEEVWPEVRARCPDGKVRLVGRQPAPEVLRLSQLPGVEVVGPVTDVRPYVARSAVSIVPLRMARGVQNKVLEALAMSKAVVVSPPSLAGLKAQPGVHLLAALSAAEWVEAVVRLLEDEPLRRNLGAAGRGYVETHHSWDRCLEPLGQLLELPRGPDPAPEPPTLRTEPAAQPALFAGETGPG